jgi:hypothetical protein
MNYTGQLVGGLAVLLLYLWMVLFAASSYIRMANVRWVEAHEAALRGRLKAAAANDAADIDSAIAVLVAGPPAGGTRRSGRWTLVSPSNWIGSCEIARWVRLHEAQRLEIAQMTDSEVQARFARAMGQIDELPVVRQNAWQRRWVDLQNSSRCPGPAAGTRDAWRADLSQLLGELFNARDSTYNQLVSLYGKAGWLIFAAYLPVMALLVAGYGPVLLAGFLGGLVSRMQRLVYAQGRPTAYGTSWVPLFLAPLLGALAAWAGLHLLVLMQGLRIVSLENVLVPGADLRLIPSASVLGLAVLFGFSERLFNQLGDQAEKIVTADQGNGSAAAAGSPASTVDKLDPGARHSAASGEGDHPHRPFGTSNGRPKSGRVGRPSARRSQ